MKKKVLFVISTLRCGGAEHALISLLNVLDYDRYDVDLLVLCQTGMFYRDNIPKQVHFIEPELSVRAVLEPNMDNMKECLKTGHWKYIVMHIKRLIKKKIKPMTVKTNFWSEYWKRYNKYVHPLKTEYDTAIGYLEGLSNYFCIDKVDAKCKIGWMHTNYLDSKQNYEMDKKYFSKFDKMITMSEPASETLRKAFPEISNKIYTMHNVLDEKEVRKLSLEKVDDIEKKDNEVVIVSVGNVLPVKGYDIAVEACSKLVEQGKNIKWYVIGRKDQPEKIEEMIKAFHLEEHFFLTGMRKNPYKYMKMADIYVQCSRYEGFSTTIREAKLLCKPIVATDCQGINDQIVSGTNGTLVTCDADAFFREILELIEQKDILQRYVDALEVDAQNATETKKDLNKLYELMG